MGMGLYEKLMLIVFVIPGCFAVAWMLLRLAKQKKKWAKQDQEWERRQQELEQLGIDTALAFKQLYTLVQVREYKEEQGRKIIVAKWN